MILHYGFLKKKILKTGMFWNKALQVFDVMSQRMFLLTWDELKHTREANDSNEKRSDEISRNVNLEVLYYQDFWF
ncbi:hypothetical protein LXL04_021947 [Taraxacum kok-saghyz]